MSNLHFILLGEAVFELALFALDLRDHFVLHLQSDLVLLSFEIEIFLLLIHIQLPLLVLLLKVVSIFLLVSPFLNLRLLLVGLPLLILMLLKRAPLVYVSFIGVKPQLWPYRLSSLGMIVCAHLLLC